MYIYTFVGGTSLCLEVLYAVTSCEWFASTTFVLKPTLHVFLPLISSLKPSIITENRTACSNIYLWIINFGLLINAAVVKL